MKVSGFTIDDARFERSPGQDADILIANVVDERDGGPMSIGYGRYGPGQALSETMAVDDVMFVLDGRVSVTSDGQTVTAEPGGIIYMPAGASVTIRAHEDGALTAFATYPHWRPLHD